MTADVDVEHPVPLELGLVDAPSSGSIDLHLEATPARPAVPPCMADPETYRLHANRHRQARDGSWSCDACAEAVP